MELVKYSGQTHQPMSETTPTNFEMVDDVWFVILTKLDKASLVCFKYSSGVSYSIATRLGYDSLISNFELGESSSVGIVKWARENGALRCDHRQEVIASKQQRFTSFGGNHPYYRRKLVPLSCVRSGAAKANSVGLIKWLKRNEICPHDDYPAIAVQHGSLGVLRTVGDRTNVLREYAIRYGQLEALKFLGTKEKPLLSRLAAISGQVHILEHLGVSDPRSVALAAAEHGHPAVLSWMKENDSINHHGVILGWIATTAAKYGQTSVLEWLVTEMPLYRLTRDLIEMATQYEHTETTQWLVEALDGNSTAL